MLNLAAPYSDAVSEGSLPQVRVDQGSGHPNLDILFGYFVFFMRAAVTQIWIFFSDVLDIFLDEGSGHPNLYVYRMYKETLL